MAAVLPDNRGVRTTAIVNRLTARRGGHRCLLIEVGPKRQDGSVALDLHLAHGSSQEETLELASQVRALGGLSPWSEHS